ncbi:hypothetical protein ACWEPC_28870 [Nonomuraea sp. NPDC004297]
MKPGTGAVYELTDVSTTTWTTKAARSNGVIHHEDEIRLFGTSILGGALDVSVTVEFTDECSNTPRSVYLGRLKVTKQ